MARKRLFVGCALFAVVILVVHSSAVAGPWAHNPSGSNPSFGWSNGIHLNLPGGSAHGSPDVYDWGFQFANSYGDMHYLTEVGGTTSINAGVSVRLKTATSTPPGALPFPFITVREWGTWGGDTADLAVQADFVVYEYVTGYLNSVVIDLSPIVFDTDNHTWMKEATFMPGPGHSAPWDDLTILRDIKIDVHNLVGVQGSTPGTFIEKKGLQIIVPEPASILLLAAVAPFVFRRPRA